MNDYFVVTEIQVANGVPAVLTWAFDSYVNALEKYYTILSVACKSTIDIHGAYLLSTNGDKLKSEIFDKRTPPEE